MWPFLLFGLVGIATYWWSLKLKGTKFAILGHRETGKTTLINFLMNGELPNEYISTPRPEKFNGKTVNLQEIEFKIADIIDMPGTVAAYVHWEPQYKDADVVCYLIDAHKIHDLERVYEDIVIRDMQNISKWFDARKDAGKDPPKFFLVATHCDLIPEYEKLPVARRTEFTDEFWKMAVPQKLVFHGNGSKHVKLVAGSFQGKDESERLVSDILREVSS